MGFSETVGIWELGNLVSLGISGNQGYSGNRGSRMNLGSNVNMGDNVNLGNYGNPCESWKQDEFGTQCKSGIQHVPRKQC